MPVTTGWQGPVLVVTTVGTYANQEMADALAGVLADPRFAPGTPIVFDARESKAELTRQDVEWRMGTLVAFLKQRGFGPRVALVLARGETYRYGVARMIQTRSEFEGFTVDLFHDLDQAIQWATGETTSG